MDYFTDDYGSPILKTLDRQRAEQEQIATDTRRRARRRAVRQLAGVVLAGEMVLAMAALFAAALWLIACH